MRERLKFLSTLLIAISIFAGFCGWIDDRPNLMTWVLRIGSPAVFFAALLTFVFVHFSPDDAPDFLRERFGNMGLDRKGFSFLFVPRTDGGHFHLDMYFQNRFEGSCDAQVRLRPLRPKLRAESELLIEFRVPCGPAAFGVVRLPVTVPRELQGRHQEFEIGARVTYPQGRGRELRSLRIAALGIDIDFRNVIGEIARIGQIVHGAFLLNPGTLRKPESTMTVKFRLPQFLEQPHPARTEPEIEVLWSLDQLTLAELPRVTDTDRIG